MVKLVRKIESTSVVPQGLIGLDLFIADIDLNIFKKDIIVTITQDYNSVINTIRKAIKENLKRFFVDKIVEMDSDDFYNRDIDGVFNRREDLGDWQDSSRIGVEGNGHDSFLTVEPKGYVEWGLTDRNGHYGCEGTMDWKINESFGLDSFSSPVEGVDESVVESFLRKVFEDTLVYCNEFEIFSLSSSN